MNKYKEVFLSEAQRHIEGMNYSLLKLENEPTKKIFVGNVFREIHTLKSVADTMKYENTTRLCHAMEDVLEKLKKNKIPVIKCIDPLLECCDTLGAMLKEIKNNDTELDVSRIVEKLNTLEIENSSNKGKDKPMPSLEHSKESLIPKIERINVNVETLDTLMNLAEELLINKMRFEKIKEELDHPDLSSAVDAQSRLVEEVQYNVMQSRMVPIAFVFNIYPRMVRDLAKKQDKKIDLVLKGEDLELDRAVIDEIGESLVHLIRNAVDHGIENPQVRKKAGKPPTATIQLIATRAKNFAEIKVIDDGGGINLEDVKAKGIRLGVLSSNATKEEVINAIFSDVSTTKKVTEVSGRGLGLSIVKNKIETLGGSVAVDTEFKKGTTFTIEMPLSLAIIKNLFVEVGKRSYGIPVGNVVRLVTVNKEDIKGMMNYEAIILNEEDVPITRLSTLFKIEDLNLQKQPIVVVRQGEEMLGLAVDAFLTTEEIVVRPLNKTVRENRNFSGSTIIGSGEVVLILDVANLMPTKRATAEAQNV